MFDQQQIVSYWFLSLKELLYYLYFQRQWNFNSNIDVPIVDGTVCFYDVSNYGYFWTKRKKHSHFQNFGNLHKLCILCYSATFLLKWRCQFQKQGFAKRIMESFENRTFSDHTNWIVSSSLKILIHIPISIKIYVCPFFVCLCKK